MVQFGDAFPPVNVFSEGCAMVRDVIVVRDTDLESLDQYLALPQDFRTSAHGPLREMRLAAEKAIDVLALFSDKTTEMESDVAVNALRRILSLYYKQDTSQAFEASNDVNRFLSGPRFPAIASIKEVSDFLALVSEYVKHQKSNETTEFRLQRDKVLTRMVAGSEPMLPISTIEYARRRRILLVDGYDRQFTARIVREGDVYGANFCLIQDGFEPKIEFYDASAPIEAFGCFGQFVGRYYVSTLLTHSMRHPKTDLNLHGGVPEWVVPGRSVKRAMAWAEATLMEDFEEGSDLYNKMRFSASGEVCEPEEKLTESSVKRMAL